ncbi:hypothetical protein [Treponema zioleckii]|uniref:hypothetical protein n=1 Tax=Treponema zioleckii TaxID=331680 RepID=UPI00168B6E86|nr:hypothetical protein [Treponema zioleckii]
MLRLAEKLIIDHYEIPFKILTILETMAALALTAFTIYFMPVRIQPKNYGVQKQIQTFYGTSISGIHLRDTPYENSQISGYLYTYSRIPEVELPQRFIHEELDFEKKLQELKSIIPQDFHELIDFDAQKKYGIAGKSSFRNSKRSGKFK